MLETLEELKAFLQPYKTEEDKVNNDKDETQYYQYREFILKNIQLPEFFTTEPANPVYTICIDEGPVYRLFNEKNQFLRESTDVLELYDSVHSRTADIVFEGDYENIEGISTAGKINPTLFVKEPGRTSGRMLISHTGEDSLYLDKAHYLDFLHTAEKYLEDPKDFLTAWYFLSNHPYAWYRHTPENEYSWSTHELTSKIWVSPTTNDAGELVFMMEAGAAVEPERTSHYHDLRLDVYADSYNNGIIELAALVHKFYHLDGSERENVEYQKSELELTLERRLADVQQAREE